MKCVLCKSEIPEGSLFCNICGRKQDRIQNKDQADLVSDETLPRRRRRRQFVADDDSNAIKEVELPQDHNAGFMVASSDGSKIGIECSRCGKVYEFDENPLLFPEIEETYCVPLVLIRCPNCKNFVKENTKIFAKETVKIIKPPSLKKQISIACPHCGSERAKRIGNLNRSISVALWGFASSKIGKQYECDNCKHKW